MTEAESALKTASDLICIIEEMIHKENPQLRLTFD